MRAVVGWVAEAGSPDVKSKVQVNPYIDKILKLFHAECRTPNLQVWEVLELAFPSPEDRTVFSLWVHEKFPAVPGVQYMTKYQPGPVILRPYTMAWHKDAGNHGVVMHENMGALITLVLTNGFRSNSDVDASVERFAIHEPSTKLFPDAKYPKLQGQKIGCQEINFQKGWFRCNALYFILYALHELDVFDDFRASCEHRHTSQTECVQPLPPIPEQTAIGGRQLTRPR